MEKPDKSIDYDNTDIELIKPIQLTPLLVPMGRPSSLTTDIEDELCEYIEQGGTISSYVTQSPRNISRQQINNWFNINDNFRLRYDNACLNRAKYGVETLNEINQSVADGHLHPSAAKVISTNIQWVSGKDNPKKYGEASLVKLANSEGGELGIVGMLAQITE